MFEKIKELLGIRSGYMTWEEFQQKLKQHEELRKLLELEESEARKKK